MSGEKLPVHGFVLAGGKSSRMGVDKATLGFCGLPMVEIAVEKLRGFCTEVGIAGNREDLAGFAPVVCEERVGAGPAAGIEAGLLAARQEWVMFLPVDVPLLPVEVLRRWGEAVLAMNGILVSHLYYGRNQPAFCMLRRECGERFSRALDSGERRLDLLLHQASEGFHWVHDLGDLYGEEGPVVATANRWFSNVNTRQELAEAEAWALRQNRDGQGSGGGTILGADAGMDADALAESVHHKKNGEKNCEKDCDE